MTSRLWWMSIALSATSSAPFRLYNIGNHQPVQLMRYIEVLEEKLAKPILVGRPSVSSA